MQIQSYLCQLGVKNLEEIAKPLGCSDDDTKGKNRKGLVRLIEEKLEGTLEAPRSSRCCGQVDLSRNEVKKLSRRSGEFDSSPFTEIPLQEKSATVLYRQLSTLVQEPHGFAKFLNKGLRYKAEDSVCVKGGRHLIKV